MKLDSGERLLTVRNIAASIAFDKSKEGIARTIRQVRHWTQCDILRPAGEKSTGTGIPRFYSIEPTIEIAALLLEVSRYGATVDVLKPLADTLYEDFEEEGLNFFVAASDEGQAYLEVAWDVDQETGRFTNAEINLFVDDPRFDDFIVLSRKAHSSIVIRMNQVFRRLTYPKAAE